ncbi:MAG: zinc-binding dehydrogenase [Candidatus Bathyarchaeota archaeon]|nr:MAG: zinc-binding dehydrogenase [Candidatus Bathyarchaeota archaeon]
MSNGKMKAAMLYGVKDLRVEDIESPQIDKGEILVEIKAATSCGTDLKIFQRGYVKKIIELPTAFGHEWAGDVVEVGNNVTWPRKGMRIRAGNSAPCLRCKMCQNGKYNLCEDMLWLWGAYAEYIRVPARTILVNAQEIPLHINYEEAAMVEPLACVMYGAEKANIKLGDSVAIIGAGPIGLLHLLIAKKRGAEKVIISDLLDERLEFAQDLGADEIINAKNEDTIERIRQLTKGYGVNVVIEAIGFPSTWEQALKMVSKGGTVLEFGGCPPDTNIVMSTELLHYGDVTVMGSFHATPIHFKRAMNLVASGGLNVKPLVTRRMPLDKIQEAFEILTTSKSDIKIAIIP